MLGKTGTRVDQIANVLTIVVAIIFIGLFVQRYILASKPSSRPPTIGRSLSLSGLDPSQSRRSILLVMMKGCRFCEASMGFYRTLRENRDSRDRNIVAVFPPGTEDVDSYLTEHGLGGIDVKFAALSDLEVSGTPTIIVIDDQGKIVRSWVGKLSSELEIEVKNFLES